MTDLGDFFADIVTDGFLLLAAAIAALVGLISFASPVCCPWCPASCSSGRPCSRG